MLLLINYNNKHLIILHRVQCWFAPFFTLNNIFSYIISGDKTYVLTLSIYESL